MTVSHFEKVDHSNIISDFTDDLLHRKSLIIPLLERGSQNTLCIIGQNPSDANETHADPTLRYIEQFVFENLPEYSKIIMLNLYSRVDTKKEYTTDLVRPETHDMLIRYINEYSNFLLAYGASKKDGAYDFAAKIAEIQPFLKNKNIFKIDIGLNTNYPPHPGNPKILYRNFNYGITKYEV